MELPSAFKFKILELVIKHPNHLARTPYQNRSCIFLSFLKKLCTFSLRSFPEDLLDPKADYSFNNSSDTESLILRIQPLPSISRGNLQSPTNSPVTGVVRPFSVTQNDEKPVTYVEKNRRYNEKETRKEINKSYRKEVEGFNRNLLFYDTFEVFPPNDFTISSPVSIENTASFNTPRFSAFVSPHHIDYHEKPRLQYGFPPKEKYGYALCIFKLEQYRSRREKIFEKNEKLTKLLNQLRIEELSFSENQTVENFIGNVNRVSKRKFITDFLIQGKPGKTKLASRTNRRIIRGSYGSEVDTTLLPKLLRYVHCEGKGNFRLHIFRSGSSQMFLKIGVLKKNRVLVPFFNKVSGFEALRFQHRCFPVKFANVLEKSFFTGHAQWLLLYCSVSMRRRIDLEIC